MELFWRISQDARVALILYQGKVHKDKPKLDMAGRIAPWEEPPPVPEIPAHIDMTEQELQKFLSQAPHSPRRVE